MDAPAAVVWTARGAALLTLAAVALRARPTTANAGEQSVTSLAARIGALCWLAAFVMLVLHELLAFAVVHHWSHTAALEHTAERTAQVIGVRWGGGLYFNYAVTLLWGIDVARLGLRMATRRAVRGRCLKSRDRLHALTVACVTFAVFNATAVFGHPAWWAVVGAWLVVLVFFRRAAHADGRGSTDRHDR